MEYQKTIILSDNKPRQSSKVRTKNCVEMNDDSHGNVQHW